MGRMYSMSFSGVASAASLDLLELTSPSTAAVIVHEVGISQGTELGDAQEEMLLLEFKRGVTTGSGGTAGTNVAFLSGDSAFGGATEYGNTTKATGGSVLYRWYWNVRVPFQMIWTPETRVILPPSTTIVVTQSTTPADSITYGGYIVFEAVG